MLSIIGAVIAVYTGVVFVAGTLLGYWLRGKMGK